eukprot:GHVS01002419.1.p1 GENE.GHVS01002419.1~~GHVS01002419.1.p1  ORF type:complete len:135 (-),score=12.52 GHVS01002419.1:729-1133(-)
MCLDYLFKYLYHFACREMMTFRMVVLAVIAAIAIGGLAVEADEQYFCDSNTDCEQKPRGEEVLFGHYDCLYKIGGLVWYPPLKGVCANFRRFFVEKDKVFLDLFIGYVKEALTGGDSLDRMKYLLDNKLKDPDY